MQHLEAFAEIRVRAEAAARYIRLHSPERPVVGIILGSGLGALADQVENPSSAIPYADLPYFPVTSVDGHAGELVTGRLAGKPVWIMCGRAHYYEGLSPASTAFPVRVMKAAGVHALIVTNAAGGLNPSFAPGDLMLIADQINLIGLAGHSPLVGPHDPLLGERFPSMIEAYDPAWRESTLAAARRLGSKLRQGVYVMVGGPSYETPAEVRFLRLIGADAVGMSTANEVIAARHGGQRVLGISCITNVLGEGVTSVAHEEVLAAAKRAEPRLVALIKEVVREMAV